MEKSIYRSICYYGLPDEDYLFVSFDDFTLVEILGIDPGKVKRRLDVKGLE